MKKIRYSLITLASLLSLSFASSLQKTNHPVKAVEELSIQSGGDDFILLDKQYGVDESFVYTADLHFKSGQAGGIAFGCEEGNHYYVLNMDRYENRVKLIYFAAKPEGGYLPTELRNDYFIGNDKITQAELDMINPEIRNIENVNLKVILTREDEHAYVELYVEGIKRFGIDSVIDLNNLGTAYKYQGGYLGMNCFNADVYLENIEIGKSDYSYFSEPYRNQYHLQSFSKWTNDPNALCYYNGYYHVFYQTHPFGLYWGSMYWGHARSKDLIHFEFLPICLFPETEASGFGPGNAYMWSGCAIAYTYGMSSAVDERNWFPNGGGNGMLAIFTRDGGLQDQVVISSDDEGLTWTKRHRIPQTISGFTNKTDFRDPKVFPVVKNYDGTVVVWGMTLSNYAHNRGYFLKSTNLLDWSLACEFNFPTPECIGVGFIKDNLNQEHAYLTNKSRTYLLGQISYDFMSGTITFIDETGHDISQYSLEQMPLKQLDFGPDSYASQSFYINDPNSEFNGKDIVLNWFSGDLNASFCTGPGEYAGLRQRWNGGFTIPVEYGVLKTNEGYRLTQKPITVNNPNLEKTTLLTLENEELNIQSENPLKDVHTHIFELSASIQVKNNSPITFRVDVGDDEYMQFGWNDVDGYYVDRTYLDDKGINTNIDWHTKYASHIFGDSDVKTFYVLSDNGGLEVFCEDYSIPFYFVTTASMYSTGALLKADDAVVQSLEINEVKSIYRQNVAPDEGVLYVATNEVALDKTLSNSKFITCWYSGNEDLSWELLEGEGIVDYQTSNQGINLVALEAGSAQFKVSAGNQEQIISVTVYDSTFVSDLTFDKDDVVSGQWIMTGDTIVGEMSSGNGFLLAQETGSNFTFTGTFDILSGTAAALVFRAASDMSKYLVANYDAGEGIVKLWSTHGELTRSEHLDIGLSDIALTVRANEKDVNVTVNGISAINYTLKDDEPLTGHYGLNVFSGKAQFKSLTISKESNEFDYNSGDLAVELALDQFITAIYNVTLGNTRLEPGFYYQNDGVLYIRDSYFNLLNKNGRYKFQIVGVSYNFAINVNVDTTFTFEVDDVTVDEGSDVTVFVGNNDITSVEINGEEISSDKYIIKDYTLHLDESCFEKGDNEVTLNGYVSFTVTINAMDDVIVNPITKTDYTPVVIAAIAGSAVILLAALLTTVIILKKKGKK